MSDEESTPEETVKTVDTPTPPEEPPEEPPVEAPVEAPPETANEHLRSENRKLIRNAIKSGRNITVQSSPEGHEYYRGMIVDICNEHNTQKDLHKSQKWHVTPVHGMFMVNNMDVKFIGYNERHKDGACVFE